MSAVQDALATHHTRSVLEARAESLSSIEVILERMGYPRDWAVELEQKAWESGRLWRPATPRKRERYARTRESLELAAVGTFR